MTQIDSIAVHPLPGGPATIARFLLTSVPQWLQVAGAILGGVVGVIVLVMAWKHRAALSTWLHARPRTWWATVGVVAFLLAGAGAFAGLKTWNFMMHDNSFCSSCHVMQDPFRRFEASEHSELGCHDCHRQGMAASARQLFLWVADRPDAIGPHAPVPNRVCAECHVRDDPTDRWERIAQTAGHAVHLNPASPAMRSMECATCHAQEVHAFRPTELTCSQAGCHDQMRIELGTMAAQTALHCSTCHEFTAEPVVVPGAAVVASGLTPGQEQCLSCHAMRERLGEFSAEADPHGGTCGMCHDPHRQTTPRGAFQSCATSDCHVGADTLTAMHRNLTTHRLETCGACHVAHTWRAEATDCVSCHSGIRDPAVQVPRRPPPTGGGAASLARGPSPGGQALYPAGHPRSATNGAPYTGSHAPYTLPPRRTSDVPPEPDADPGGDTAAGDGEGIAYAGAAATIRASVVLATTWRPAPHTPRDTIPFRHDQHRSTPCTTCHGSDRDHGTIRRDVALNCAGCHHTNDARGLECAQCHRPDEFAPTQPVTATFALSVSPVPQRRTLTFSHARHESRACTDCHATTAARTVQATCASCHAEHHTAEGTCESCHAPARDVHTAPLHFSGCTTSGCHVTEATPAITPVRAVCLACHVEQRDHEPGGDCAQCHRTQWVRAAQ